MSWVTEKIFRQCIKNICRWVSCQAGARSGSWIATVRSCSPGTVFDEKLNRCNFRAKVARCQSGETPCSDLSNFVSTIAHIDKKYEVSKIGQGSRPSSDCTQSLVCKMLICSYVLRTSSVFNCRPSVLSCILSMVDWREEILLVCESVYL